MYGLRDYRTFVGHSVKARSGPRSVSIPNKLTRESAGEARAIPQTKRVL